MPSVISAAIRHIFKLKHNLGNFEFKNFLMWGWLKIYLNWALKVLNDKLIGYFSMICFATFTLFDQIETSLVR